jgi:hypothetical protein
VYIQYLGKIPVPADIKLYTAFNNRECLHVTPECGLLKNTPSTARPPT